MRKIFNYECIFLGDSVFARKLIKKDMEYWGWGDGQQMDRDRGILLGLFPAELWMKVFDAAGDAEALWTLHRSCKLWSSLLENKRVEYLFPQVIKVVCDQNYLTPEDTLEILKYRLVCKMWKQGVNRLLETRPPINKLEFYGCHHQIAVDFSYLTYFRIYKPHILPILGSQIMPMLSSPRYQQQQLNPFPSRHLEILERRLVNTQACDWNDNVAFNHYRTLTQHFLQVAGHHFWYVQIDTGLNMPPLAWYDLIVRYMELMPNLKFLTIQCPPCFSSYELNMLNDIPAFPALKHLKLLSLENAPTSVMNAIFAANRKIKMLMVSPKLRLPTHDEQLEPQNYYAIQDPHTFSISFTCQREFNSLPRDWKLKVLRLGLKSCIDLHWSCIFGKLEYYWDSLTELHLWLPKAATADNRLILWESTRTKLNLPKLKKLQLQICNYCSLDFLLGLLSLEHLRIHFMHQEVLPPHRGTEAQVINVNTIGFSRFIECNVWELIPSLMKVNLQFNSGVVHPYTRAQRV